MASIRVRDNVINQWGFLSSAYRGDSGVNLLWSTVALVVIIDHSRPPAGRFQ